MEIKLHTQLEPYPAHSMSMLSYW